MGAVDGTSEATLGRYLASLRASRGMSQRTLAEVTKRIDGHGVTASHIAHIEAKGLGAKREKVELLANALLLSTEEHAELSRLAGYGDDKDWTPTQRFDALERRVGQIEEVLEVIEERLRDRGSGRRRGAR